MNEHATETVFNGAFDFTLSIAARIGRNPGGEWFNAPCGTKNAGAQMRDMRGTAWPLK
jgi:hypothetical protein